MWMRALVCLGLVIVAGVADAAPRVKPVTLARHTTLTVDIVPDLGTRFIFPFVLDEQDEYVPFTLNITNPAFVSKREPGRNSFVVTIPPTSGGRTAQYYGNLFVTVAGYEISIELRSTTDLNRHYSDINFELSDAERETLIQKSIAQRTKVLEAEYKKKMDTLDQLADLKAMGKVGVIAQHSPSTKRIKEEQALVLKNGDKIKLYVDKELIYSPYHIISFEVDSDSNTEGVTILDAKLFGINPDTKQPRPIESAKDVPPRIPPRETVNGIITTLDGALNPSEYVKLVVLTDKGEIAAQW
jgi:hypothetical protein